MNYAFVRPIIACFALRSCVDNFIEMISSIFLLTIKCQLQLFMIYALKNSFSSRLFFVF